MVCIACDRARVGLSLLQRMQGNRRSGREQETPGHPRLSMARIGDAWLPRVDDCAYIRSLLT
eukprot:33349-Pleurochrysis_carterae.AAC.1